MNKFVLITATFGVPLLVFLIAQDASKTFYKAEGEGLSYVIVDPEDLAAEEAAAEEAVVEDEAVEEEVAEAEVAEEEGADEAAVEEEAIAAVEEEPAEDAPAEEVAEAEAEGEASEAVEAPIELAALSDDEMKAAAREVRKCTSCHQLEKEGKGVGPHLVGVVGRPVGSIEDFRYSDALVELGEAGQVWTQEELIAWLEDPRDYAPGTKMNFKVRDAEDRRLIAGWLAANPAQ